MTDTSDISLRCFCGELEGVATRVSPAVGTHVVCYCDDCQTFQHAIGQAERVLDEHGGTEIFQMSAGQLSISKGLERLSCLRLSPKGVVRWYASCCNAPIGNTMDRPTLPFVGLVATCFDRSGDTAAVSRALGPLKKGVFGKHALGDTSDLYAHDGVPFAAIGGFLVKLVRWRLRGDHKRSPFFDRDSGELIAEPWVLSKEERDAARSRIGVSG